MLSGRRAALGITLLISALLALIGALILAGAPTARADGATGPPDCPPGYVLDPGSQTCVITVTSPGGNPTPAPTQGGGGTPPPCQWTGSGLGGGGVIVACTSPQYGSWSNSLQCYVKPDTPQPPATDPAWAGHQPGDGSIWLESCPGMVSGTIVYLTVPTWFAAPPTGPDPAALALEASKEMTMLAPAIDTAPGNGQPALVGAPVWVWDAKGPDTWGPQTVTVAAGGLSVTATSTVTGMSVDFGDGTTLACTDGGTPYSASDPSTTSPDCGHVYTVSSATLPGGVYTLTATSTWVLAWIASDGQTGTMTFRLTSTPAIAVGSAQAVILGGTP